ncbi:cytochrome c oxidase subunit 3 [Oceanicaulis sp. AH-315-P02]|nr:cytochrome c oxidase subunit 3 [Robiginitomaculum sp.]MBN4047702.1 cytochrome c oxidase subunit 3 [Oceanicaulis sp. AH-315-P02]
MSDQTAQHDYHLVDPNPWPLVGAVSAFVMTFGGVAYMSGIFGIPEGSPWLLILGFIGVLITMYGWWSDVIREGTEGFHTPVVELGMRYGMILFIMSEVMFFVAWFWLFFEGAMFIDTRTTEVWPPVGIETFNPWHLPLANTLVLLLSGTTVTWAHHALIEGDRKSAKIGLLLTVLLGGFFTYLQALEYIHAGFAFSGNLYGATFFMATGFHGAHVIIGTIFLAVCLFRLMAGAFTPKNHFGFEAAAWYWHFVDVVWLFLFIFVYVVYAG